MPISQGPPQGVLNKALFDDIHDNHTYSANDLAFENTSTSTLYYLYVENAASTPYKCVWVLVTVSAESSNPNPWGKIPQATADTILGGTWKTGDKAVTYQGTDYRFRLEWDSSSDTYFVERIAI